MVLFKINGERNSGTNFLTKLLQLNNLPIFVDRVENNVYHYWKHAVPNPSVKNLDERVVDIFIFRNLDGWLQSMYVNAYHLYRYSDFKKFLTSNQSSTETTFRNISNNILNYDDNGKTIFQIRYHKFNSIMKYREENRDVILINLQYLQNAYNVSLFLADLNKRYFDNQHKMTTNAISHHTKHGGNVKNTNYLLNINNVRPIINRERDKSIEGFISNLTYDIKE